MGRGIALIRGMIGVTAITFEYEKIILIFGRKGDENAVKKIVNYAGKK